MRHTRRSPRPPRAARSFDRLEPRLVMATFTVNSLADILSPPAGTVTLRSAIQAANASPAADTINLTLAGTYKITTIGGATDNSAGEFAIADAGDLTIQNTSGGTATVDGGGLNRVFDVDPAASAMPFTATFRGLVIQGGVVNADGAGIRVSGAASVTLDHSTLLNNLSLTEGAGIAMEPASTGTLTLLGSRVVNNRALASGGGIAARGTGAVVIGSQSEIAGNISYNNDGGGIWLAGAAPLAVVGANIHDNRAINGIGGGVANNAAGSVAISGSIIEDNSARIGGGYADAGTGPLTIANSFVLNNAAGANGGGIDAGGTSINLTNTTVSGNSAVLGGGMHLHGTGTTRITDSSILGNGGNGAGGIADEATKLIVTGSTFASNRALGNGGAIVAFGTVGDVSISNSLFRDNATYVSGGALYFLAGTLEVSASRFTGNASQTGGAANLAATSFSIVNSTFDANRAIIAGALSLTLTGAGNALTNDTFFANAAQKDGAIRLIGAANTTLTMTDDTVDGNTATATTGGVDQTASNLVVQGTILAKNTAADAPSDYTYTGGTLADKGGNLLGSTAGSGNKFGTGTLVVVGDPKLGPLLDNGGSSAGAPADSQIIPTQALLPGSPAFAKGLAGAGIPTSDQRGFARPAKPAIGAYEPQYAANATPNQVFVENLFEVLLNRAADPASLASSVNYLNGGGSGVTLVQILQGSSEFRGIEAVQLYKRYFDRIPSAAEVANLANFLAAGNTPEQVAAIFIGTSEFFGDAGNDVDVFVEAVYRDTLARAASPVERGGWVQILAQGGTRTGVATLFVDSAEYLDLLVAADYDAFLGRAPTPAELANLARAWPGFTGLQIEAVLLGSGESLARRT